MAKRGRPKWQPPDLDKVEALGAQGLTLKEIAAVLGISYQTLNEHKKAFSDFSDALKRGQAKGIATITNALRKSALGGNVAAQIFYLKTRAGWKETVVNEHSGVDGKPIQHHNCVVVLPKEAETIDEWLANNHLDTPTRSSK